ncbi:MAG: PepSY-like domain-containing protein [Chitinophagaceae bacterium]
MKLRIQGLAVAGIVLLTSCGSASSDKENAVDTVSTVTTNSSTMDNTTVRKVEVPSTTRTTFEAKYPQASNVRWDYYRPDISYIDWEWSGWPGMDTSDYVANFNLDGTDYWAWYDQDGNWVGTTNKMTDNSSLPAAVNNTINSKYNGYTIVSVDKENDKNRTAYEIQMEKGSDKLKLLVDEKGNIMKKKMVSGDMKTKEKMDIKDSAM